MCPNASRLAPCKAFDIDMYIYNASIINRFDTAGSLTGYELMW